jgi:2,5-diketo-D-gluconate reductase B
MSEHLEIRGTRVPSIGFGTWQITGRDCVEAVRDALDIGYRHVDTAKVYENEAEVGRGIADSGVAREGIFLTTKVWIDEFEPDALKGSAERSLRYLGVDYVDLLLLHWPVDAVPIEASLGAMAELQDAGKVLHFGLSNFPPRYLREALSHQPVFTDQVEFHPFLEQDDLLAIAAENDMLVTAYAPLAHGKVIEDETLREIGDAHGKTAGQVALRYLLDKPRTCVIPKASSHERRAQNFDVFDFSLSDEERARIDALPKDQRDFAPSFGPKSWD